MESKTLTVVMPERMHRELAEYAALLAAKPLRRGRTREYSLEDALLLAEDTLTNYYGKFTLVIEGAAPTKDGGIYNVIARTKKSPVTALEAVTRLGPLRTVILGRIIRSFDPCISCATH